jgi:tetratricopeptide (TPR) repeat protein
MMPISLRSAVTLGCLATIFAGSSHGQEAQRFTPLRPLTKQELARRQALSLYGLGRIRQNQDRLVEATRSFEEALHLDPQATPIYRALIPLYFALGRVDDGLAGCRKTLDLDPDDYQTWGLYARQLRAIGKKSEASAALEHALACPGLAGHLDVRMQIVFDLGVLCEETKRTDAAIERFSEVVRVMESPDKAAELGAVDPTELRQQAASLYDRLIRLCIDAKEYDRALALFAEARKSHPALARRLNYNLAQVELARGRAAPALGYIDEFLRTQPQGAEAYELRSMILRKLGRERDIVPALRQYAAGDPHNLALHLLWAEECARAGRKQEAETIFHDLAEQAPTSEIYRKLFGLYCSDPVGGRAQHALALFNDAIRRSSQPGELNASDAQEAAKARAMLQSLRDDNALATAFVTAARLRLIQCTELHPETRFFLAVLAAKNHQLEQAEQFYRHCLSDFEDNPQRETAIYGGLIQVLLQERKYPDVVQVCLHGLEHAASTNRLYFHLNLARAQAALGNMDEAVRQADRAIELADERNRLGMRLLRIDMLARAERFPQAVGEAESLLKNAKTPGETRDIRYQLSSVYSTMHNHSKAEEQLQLILKDDPNDATANNDLGYFWADQGKNLPEAERMIRKALDLDSQSRTGTASSADEENYAYLDSLGWVLFRRGQIEEAQRWLERAAAGAGVAGDPVVWDHLGDVYLKMNQRERALDHWRKALLLYDADKRRKPDEHYHELKAKLLRFDAGSTRR